MGRKIPHDLIKEKLIYDAKTGNPVKEIVVEEDKIVILKEGGDKVEIPKNTVRAKHILMRIDHGIGEITEAIYV
jgi:hypothetical protein